MIKTRATNCQHAHCDALTAPVAAVVASASTDEQLLHTSYDALGLYCPVAHGVHTSSPRLALNMPGPQGWQNPTASRNAPAAHGASRSSWAADARLPASLAARHT